MAFASLKAENSSPSTLHGIEEDIVFLYYEHAKEKERENCSSDPIKEKQQKKNI